MGLSAPQQKKEKKKKKEKEERQKERNLCGLGSLLTHKANYIHSFLMIQLVHKMGNTAPSCTVIILAV